MMQDTTYEGAIQRIPNAVFDALVPADPTAPPYPERTQDGLRIKVVPHDVFVHQQQAIARARQQRKAAARTRRQQRGR